MNASNKDFQIGKLNRTNYQTWKFKMEMVLSRDDLWEITIKDIPLKPNEEWLYKDRKAKAAISLSVEDEQITHIRRCKYAKEMWSILKRQHEKSNLSSKLFLLRQLYSAKLEIRGDMETHVNTVLDLTDKLRDIGEIVKDDHITAILLCSLPTEYETLITALEARPEKELTLEYVKGKLLQECLRKQDKSTLGDNNYNQEAAVLNTVRNPTYSRNPKICFYCNKKGHTQRQCRKLKADNKNKRQLEEKQSPKDDNSKTRTEQNQNKQKGEQTKSVNCLKICSLDNDSNWLLDSGASCHMCSSKESFSELHKTMTPIQISMADGSHITAKEKGEISLICSVPHGTETLKIKNVLFAPQLKDNLISVAKLIESGHEILFKDEGANISKNGTIVGSATLDNCLYKMNNKQSTYKTTSSQCSPCLHLWHKRLGHRHLQSIKEIKTKDLATGFNIEICNCDDRCISCLESKSTRKAFPKSSNTKSNRPFQLIHTDVCGPFPVPTPAGNKYFVSFIDDYSRYGEIYLLQSKDQVTDKLKQYIEIGKNKFQQRPEFIRSDNGGEYLNHTLDEYLKNEGIQNQLTVPFTPQQNGVSERRNRTLVEMTRCLLNESNLDEKYWGEAISTACYLINRLPSSVLEQTPFQLWHGKKPSLKHLKTFGSTVYYHINKEKRKKLDKTSKQGIFVGYSKPSKGYRILLPSTNSIIISRDITCLENDNMGEISNKDNTMDVQNSNENRSSTRINFGTPPVRYGFKAEPKTESNNNIEPSSYKQMLSYPEEEKAKWQIAMDEEMASILENQTWSLQELPTGRKAIGCKWTYKIKRDTNGNPIQYKARLVAKGYTQKYGIDYDEVFAPVVKHSTIRTLLSIAACKGMYTKHMDVKSAFLHGKLNEEIFMVQPEGYYKEDETKLVCKLEKCLYGLKQSAHEWNNNINDVLINENFKRSFADQCLYSKAVGENIIYILLYVDDLLICSNSLKLTDQAKTLLTNNFKMKDLGEVTNYLGIQIERDNNGNFLIHQSNKIRELISDFQMIDAKGSSIPMVTDFLKNKDTSSKDFEKPDLYRKGVGSLLYLSTTTRPDIAAATGFLGRKVSKPTHMDWNAMKKVISYLKSTVNLKLCLSSKCDMKLKGFADADYAGDCSDRKSTTGTLLMLGNSPIVWSSRKQSCVAVSSTEAEYISAASASQEIKWARLLLEDLHFRQDTATVLFEDNQSCLNLATNQKFSNRTKHVDVRYHLIRDYLKQGTIEMNYCPTEHMLADIFTKPLPKAKFLDFRNKLGVTE